VTSFSPWQFKPPTKETRYSLVGEQMSITAEPDVEAKRKLLSCRESNPCLPASSLVSVLIELFQLLCNNQNNIFLFHIIISLVAKPDVCSTCTHCAFMDTAERNCHFAVAGWSCMTHRQVLLDFPNTSQVSLRKDKFN
jgi:hypothetical protein